jgi:hypothetical protein
VIKASLAFRVRLAFRAFPVCRERPVSAFDLKAKLLRSPSCRLPATSKAIFGFSATGTTTPNRPSPTSGMNLLPTGCTAAGFRDRKAAPVCRARLAFRASRASPVMTERQEQMVRLALKVYRVQTARTVRTVLSVHRVTRGWRVRLGRRVIRVQMVP